MVSLRSTPRFPARAGQFYEADPVRLRRQILELIKSNPEATPHPGAVAILVPHAGYAYSGHVAAAAYQAIKNLSIDHVLLLGPSHGGDFQGAALPSHAAFATPLGNVPVDQQAVASLAQNKFFYIDDHAHQEEHSLEVQIPFLQETLSSPFAIVPLAIGFQYSPKVLSDMTNALELFLNQRQAKGEHWLLVVSSDTYHGYKQQDCKNNDEKIMPVLESMDVEQFLNLSVHREVMACGWMALTVTMSIARRLGAIGGKVLKRSDSHEMTGHDSGYVVGYIAAIFERSETTKSQIR